MKNNLKACGIVVEYNPFHNGHIHHINESRKASKCDVLIAVMSPNFVQRGEPAFVNKYDRIQAALDHGVDLIIELPSYYALQSADYFAHAAIRLLKLMAVDSVVYGVEDLDFTHATFNEESFKQGNSYAKAHDSKSSLPNNILASCYEKELLNTDIKPIRIQRTNSYTSLDSSEAISSASAIRFADAVLQLSLTGLAIERRQNSHQGIPVSNQLADFRCFTLDEYLALCAEVVKRLSPKIAIERFVSESPADILISPKWGIKPDKFKSMLEKYLIQHHISQQNS